MIEFETESGNKYYYISINNHIYPGIAPKNLEMTNVEYVVSESYLLKKISTFTIEVTQECNLRCRYCCYSGNYNDRRAHASVELSDKDLIKCIEFIGNNMDLESPYITICFYGGEALLSQRKIKQIINLLQTNHPNVEFVFSISSNGLLLNKHNIEWICNTPNLKIVITIDGDKVMHDRNRITQNGNGSFDIIMQNLYTFRKLYPDLYLQKVEFISTVKSIKDLIELNKFWMNNELLNKSVPKHISSLIPNFSKGESLAIAETPFKYFFKAAFNSYINDENNVLTNELRHFTNVIKHRTHTTIPSQQRFITCLHEPYSCFITAKGQLYICERMCQEHCIGDLEHGIEQSKCVQLNKTFTKRKNKYCSKCWAKRLCRICATNLNNNEEQFIQYCNSERMQLKLALQYFCEILEFKKRRSEFF